MLYGIGKGEKKLDMVCVCVCVCLSVPALGQAVGTQRWPPRSPHNAAGRKERFHPAQGKGGAPGLRGPAGPLGVSVSPPQAAYLTGAGAH